MKFPMTFERFILLVLLISLIVVCVFSSPTVQVNEGVSTEALDRALKNQREDIIQEFNLKVEDEAFKRDSIGNDLMSNESNWDSLHRAEFGD